MAPQRNIIWVLVFLFCINVTIAQATRPLIVVIGEPSDPDLDISPLIRSIEVANGYQEFLARESNGEHSPYLPPAVVFNPHLGADEQSYRQAIKRHCPAVYALIDALSGSHDIDSEVYSLANAPEFPFSPFWSVPLSNDPHINTHVPPTPPSSGSSPPSRVNADTLHPRVLPALPHSMVTACASVLYTRNIHSPRTTIDATNTAIFGASPAFAPVLLLLHATPAMYVVQPEHAHARTDTIDATADATVTSEAASTPHYPPSRTLPAVLGADAWAYTVTPPLFDAVLGAHIRGRLWGQTLPQPSEQSTGQEDAGGAQGPTDTGVDDSCGSAPGEQPWPVHVWGHPEPFPWYGVLPARATETDDVADPDDVADTVIPGASAELASALYHWPMSPAALLHPYRHLRHVWLCACHAVEVEEDARRVLQTPCVRDKTPPVVPIVRGQLVASPPPPNRDGCAVCRAESCEKAVDYAGAAVESAVGVCLPEEAHPWTQGKAVSRWWSSNEHTPRGVARATHVANHDCSNDGYTTTDASATSNDTQALPSAEPALCAHVEESQLSSIAPLAGAGVVGLSRGEVRLIHQRHVGAPSLAADANAGGSSAPVYEPLVAALTLLARGADAAELRRVRDDCGASPGSGARDEPPAESVYGGESCNGLDAMYQQIEHTLKQSRATGAAVSASERVPWGSRETLRNAVTSMDDDDDEGWGDDDDDDEDETFVGGTRDDDDLLSSLRAALG